MIEKSWERRCRDIVALIEASAWAEDPGETYQRMLDTVLGTFSCNQAHLHLFDAGGAQLDRCAYSTFGEDREADVQPDDGINLNVGRIKKMVKGKAPVLSDYLNPHDEDRIPQWAIDAGLRWSVTFPVFVESAVYGMCSLVYSTPIEWTEEDNEFAMLVGSAMGSAIARIRVSKESTDLKVIQDRKDLSIRFTDDMAQMIGNLSLAADGALEAYRKGDQDAIRSALELMNRVGKDSMRKLREDKLSWDTPLYLTDSLVADVRIYLETMKQTWNFDSRLNVDTGAEPPVVSMQVASQLKRIMRECMGLILSSSFASDADPVVSLTIRKDGGFVTMIIEDATGAVGSKEVFESRMALRVMQERAASVGGKMSVMLDGDSLAICVDVPVASMRQ